MTGREILASTLTIRPVLPSAPMLEQLPTYRAAYTKILTQRKTGGTLGHLEATVAGVRVRPEDLRAFQKVVGNPEDGHLPTTYPHVMIGALHAHLIASDAFPHAALGLVHVANRIRVWEAMGPEDVWDVRVAIDGQREVARGVEFDLVTEFSKDGRLVWDQTTTVLRSQRKPSKERREAAKMVEPEDIRLERSVVIRVPEDVGRRYAAVSGDYNPIHLHAVAARAFGFKRAIATGMWTLARVVAELDRDVPEAGYGLDVAFRRPIFLPSRVVLNSSREGQKIVWEVVSTDGKIKHMTGSLFPVEGEA